MKKRKHALQRRYMHFKNFKASEGKVDWRYEVFLCLFRLGYSLQNLRI